MEDSLTVGMRPRPQRLRHLRQPAFCKMTGFSPEELVGATRPMPYWAPEQLEKARHAQTPCCRQAPDDGFEMT